MSQNSILAYTYVWNAPTIYHKTLVIHVLDAAIKYKCPYVLTDVSLVIMNALHIPSIEKNLIHHSIMIQDGIQVNDHPKIQVDDPS